MEGEIQDKASCPVCLEIPDTEIYHCKNGHTVCITCSRDLKNCPQCRVVFENPKMRNRALEDLLEVLKFDCPHKLTGCTLKLTRKEIRSHRNNCLYGGEFITFCQHLGFTCGFSLNTRALPQALSHFKQEHDFVVLREAKSEIRLEHIENQNPTKNSMWTPVVIDMITQEKKLFIILCTINGIDSTFSVMCFEVSGSELETSSSNYNVYFCIDPLYKDEDLEIGWISKTIQKKHFASAIQSPAFRIPLNLLLMCYARDNTLVVKCRLKKYKNPPTHLEVQKVEQVSIVPMPLDLDHNETTVSTTSSKLLAKNMEQEESSSATKKRWIAQELSEQEKQKVSSVVLQEHPPPAVTPGHSRTAQMSPHGVKHSLVSAIPSPEMPLHPMTQRLRYVTVYPDSCTQVGNSQQPTPMYVQTASSAAQTSKMYSTQHLQQTMVTPAQVTGITTAQHQAQGFDSHQQGVARCFSVGSSSGAAKRTSNC